VIHMISRSFNDNAYIRFLTVVGLAMVLHRSSGWISMDFVVAGAGERR
jgi:hypothetical protein